MDPEVCSSSSSSSFYVDALNSQDTEDSFSDSPVNFRKKGSLDVQREKVVALKGQIGQQKGQLVFVEGDVITVIKKVNDNLWQGSIEGEIGFFDPKFTKPVEFEKISERKSIVQVFEEIEKLYSEKEAKMPHINLMVPSSCVVYQNDDLEKPSFVKTQHIANEPLLVFANPKSGGKRGATLINRFSRLLHPAQVFDITKGGPEFALKLFSQLSRFKVLACGGDGTVAWVLSEIDRHGLQDKCSVAILPLGTGNDLSRVMGWGPGYNGTSLSRVLRRIEKSTVKVLDRWTVEVIKENGEVSSYLMNNYFSLGMGAKVCYDFNKWRENNQGLFRNRFINKAAYAFDGLRDSVVHYYKNLERKVELEADGTKVDVDRMEEFIALNIPSYAGGSDLWGQSKRGFGPSSTEDKKFELVTVGGSLQFGAIKIGLSSATKLSQPNQLVIKSKSDQEFHIQVDGEAFIHKFERITINFKNQVQMLQYCK